MYMYTILVYQIWECLRVSHDGILFVWLSLDWRGSSSKSVHFHHRFLFNLLQLSTISHVRTFNGHYIKSNQPSLRWTITHYFTPNCFLIGHYCCVFFCMMSKRSASLQWNFLLFTIISIQHVSLSELQFSFFCPF